ncbi:MAG: ABC transporter substrate-binding protein [Rubrivivax sp.]|nr:ABC transporter substrate-binding protein [Rubrivivax sp.]
MQISHLLRARRRLLGLLPATLIAALPARYATAAVPGVSDREIIVGQNITRQGGRNVYGADVQIGIQACLADINRNGGVLGRQVVLRTLDDDNDAAKAEAHARQLVAGGAFVLFGSIEGGPSTAVMKAAVEMGVPFIGPMAGSPGLRRPHQSLVFPVRAEHREEFRALITHAQRVGLKRVALFHADSSVGREHLANVEKLTAEIGIAFAGGQPFKGDITDPQLVAAAAGFAERGADLVLNHGSASVYGRLIRSARAAGLRTHYWGVNSGSTPLAAALGELAKGMVFSQIVPNPRAGKTALAREYQSLLARSHPGQPLSYGGLKGYMTAKALTLALRAAGSKPTRNSLLVGLEKFDADLGDLPLRWRKGEHVGSAFVDLALVGRDGRFVQ